MFVSGLCLWGEAWHVDEPFFLAIARQILKDPLHPLSFTFNWYGASMSMARMNNTPPLLPYLLAACLRLTGGGEFWTRALFFPFDLAAAWGLLALAARFLKKPLWPTLSVLAGPAWLIDMNHVMAERVMAPFAVCSLLLSVVGVDDKDAKAFWASAVLAALALLSKYNAAFVLVPALAYAYARGQRLSRLAAWSAVTLSGFILAQLWSRAAGGDALFAASSTLGDAVGDAASAPSHRLRALLAFIGGLGLPALLWSARLKPSRRALAACSVLAAVLFAPWFDLARETFWDRAEGFLLAGGTLISLSILLRKPLSRGGVLWAPWLASVAALQLCYWAVMARFVVFLLPPLTFWLWEKLEAERPSELGRLGRAGFALSLLLGLALGAADRAYADAQKRAASEAAAVARARGATLWYWGHWGLQEYLSAAGARQFELDRGGWDQARAGDLVLVSDVNTNRLMPSRPRPSLASASEVPFPVPLRLMTGDRGSGAFYTSGMGFLPWSVSNAPLDRFTLLVLR